MQPRGSRSALRALPAAALLLLLLGAAEAKLVMVFSVQRHGIRDILPKSSNLEEENGPGPMLLPGGPKKAHDAGSQFRARYWNCTEGGLCLHNDKGDGNYGAIGAGDPSYNNLNTLVVSSGLDRTLSTAMAFMSGVFPMKETWQQVIPIHSVKDNNDWTIRGYNKCPAYTEAMLEWAQSEEFEAKEIATEEFRNKISRMLNDESMYADGVPSEEARLLSTQLLDWYNVYEHFNLYEHYGVGPAMPRPLSQADWQEMKEIAMWLELGKMRSSLVQVLGAPMLGQLFAAMKDAQATLASVRQDPLLELPAYRRLVHTSAHYNTMLTMLNALDLDKYQPAINAFKEHNPNGANWLATGTVTYEGASLPSPASLMVFELHSTPHRLGTGGVEYAVRLVVQDGDGKPYFTVPLPCEPRNMGTPANVAQRELGGGACNLGDFYKIISRKAIIPTQPERWCRLCETSEGVYPTMVDACKIWMLGQKIDDLKAQVQVAPPPPEEWIDPDLPDVPGQNVDEDDMHDDGFNHPDDDIDADDTHGDGFNRPGDDIDADDMHGDDFNRPSRGDIEATRARCPKHSGYPGWAIAVAVLTSVFGTLALAAGCWYFVRWHQARPPPGYDEPIGRPARAMSKEVDLADYKASTSGNHPYSSI